MSEKMLVTQALDERDLLVKRICDKIGKIEAVDTKKRNEEKTVTARVTVDEFGGTAQSAYQQIMDLIERYQRLDAAIVASNAVSMVGTSYGEFTVAGAIALRNRLRGTGLYENDADFECKLADKLKKQYEAAVQTADLRNKMLDSQAEDMRLSILGKDSKARDTKPLEVVDTYIRENTTEIIDPLDSKGKAHELREKVQSLITELDTRIKVSNATPTIEF